jgi:hypothetical protein
MLQKGICLCDKKKSVYVTKMNLFTWQKGTISSHKQNQKKQIRLMGICVTSTHIMTFGAIRELNLE